LSVAAAAAVAVAVEGRMGADGATLLGGGARRGIEASGGGAAFVALVGIAVVGGRASSVALVTGGGVVSAVAAETGGLTAPRSSGRGDVDDTAVVWRDTSTPAPAARASAAIPAAISTSERDCMRAGATEGFAT